MSEPRPTDQLLALAEEELGLIAGDRFEELAELQARRDAILARLPELVIDPRDREGLAQAHAMQVQVTALLERATAEMATRLGRLDHGRTSVRAYATALKQA